MADIFELLKLISTGSTSKKPITHIIAALGNPGKQYEKNRHNVGFMMMDSFAKKLDVKLSKYKFNAMCAEAVISDFRVLLMEPQTFMNNSGEAIQAAADYYNIPPKNIIILHDDIYLDPGRIRIRKKGSAGGHNGLKSIIEYLDSDEFPRVKIGVGKLPENVPMPSFVLGDIPKSDMEKIAPNFDKVFDSLSYMLKDDYETAMCRCN